MLAHEFPLIQVWSPNCPGFCNSIVCYVEVMEKWKHGLRNSNRALKPAVGVLLQPMARKVGYLFKVPDE